MKWFADRYLGKGIGFLNCVMVLALIESHAVGQCVEKEILASDGAKFDNFGYSVSISSDDGKDVAIVGVPFDGDNGSNSGSAYIFRKIGGIWLEEQKLLASDGAAQDQFGYSVSISGDLAIVGAHRDDDLGSESGSAYIYRFNGATWVEEQKLLASDGTEFDAFGIAVSIHGQPGNEVALVGSNIAFVGGVRAGAAYIFRFNGATWLEEQKLFASDSALFDGFGAAVSLSNTPGNELAIVGAGEGGGAVSDSGASYIFRYNPDSSIWIEEQKLFAIDGSGGDNFGFAVSISGGPGSEVAMVGAFGEDDLGAGSGSAFIYRFDGASWIEEQELHASPGSTGAFGFSVVIKDQIAYVGLPSGNGSVILFRKSGAVWLEVQTLIASDGAVSDSYGYSISVSENDIIAGALQHDEFFGDAGAAYIYDLPCGAGACPADTNGDATINVTDLLSLLAGWGPNPGHAADINGDGSVNVTDLLALLAAWGVCP